MAKLTKAQAKLHAEAEARLAQDRLSDDDRLFVLENWQASARHINSVAGAFFTPAGLARDFAIEVGTGRIIDLCAGIGALSLYALWSKPFDPVEIVCVEANPDYAAVGRKIVPEATWIVADVFDLPRDLGRFDYAIGNPPFGAVTRAAKPPRYPGKEFELAVIDVASDLANQGTFIVPQMSAPFRYSGVPQFEAVSNDRLDRFQAATGIVLEPNCGIDTSIYDDEWQGVSIRTEVVLADFVAARAARQPAQASFLEAAA